MVTSEGSMPFLARISSMTKRAVGWMPIFLPLRSATPRIGLADF